MREGLAWLAKNRLISSFVAVSTTVNFTQSAAQSMLVLLAVEELGLSPRAFGALLTASGVGASLGGMLSARVADRLGVHRVLLPAITLCVPLFLVMASAGNGVVLGAALAGNAFLGVMASVQMATLRQRVVPAELIGRVSSVGLFFAYGFAIPLGALAGGLLAQGVGIRAVYVGAAVVVAVLVVAVGRFLLPARLKLAVAQLDRPPARSPS